mgnify:CR=1 FL=1
MMSSPAFERNRHPIAEVLGRYLGSARSVLEVASGPGEHVCDWARQFPECRFQPSDVDPAALASIDARLASRALDNVAAPRVLDLEADAGATRVVGEGTYDCLLYTSDAADE